MSDEAIADTIAAFGQAAADAKRLGFDAAELHGAHGYLIDQFFWSRTNRCENSFGGDTIGRRDHFAAEVVRAVRRAVGAEFPVILGVSQWKQQDFTARIAETPAIMAEWLAPLVEAGVDFVDVGRALISDPKWVAKIRDQRDSELMDFDRADLMELI